METSNKTARQLYEELKANPTRRKFGFGEKAALINIDLQKVYTRTDLYKTAYETDPKQLQYVNELAALMRARGWPVIWTYVAYLDSGEDCGVWGTRTDTPDSLQNIKFGSDRSKLDERLEIKPTDIVVNKKMASPFFETSIPSLLTFHHVDTVLITGGSTSGCVRAAAVDSLSRGFRTIVIEEGVADKHESYHFANLTDMAIKYADVESVETVKAWLRPGGSRK